VSRFSLREALSTIFAPYQFLGYIPGAIAGHSREWMRPLRTGRPGCTKYPDHRPKGGKALEFFEVQADYSRART